MVGVFIYESLLALPPDNLTNEECLESCNLAIREMSRELYEKCKLAIATCDQRPSE